MRKHWFIVGQRGRSKITYLVSADNADQVCERLSVLFPIHDIKPLRYGELEKLLGTLRPDGMRVVDPVSGNIIIDSTTQAVCIWPL